MLTLASLSLGNAAWVPSSQWHESRIMIPLASFFFGNHPWVSTLHCRDSRIMVALGGLCSQTSRGFPSPLPRVPDNGHPRRPLVRKPRVGSPFPLPRMPDNGHPRRPLVRKPRVGSPPFHYRGCRIMVILGECCFRHAAVKQAPSSYTRCRTPPVISALPTRYFKHLSVFIGESMQCLT
jgi:hypothetical protein